MHLYFEQPNINLMEETKRILIDHGFRKEVAIKIFTNTWKHSQSPH